MWGAVQFRICFFGEVGLGGILKHSTWGVYLFVGLGVGLEAWGWGRCLFSVHRNLVICPSSCGSKSGGSNHGGSSPQGCINKKVFGDPKFRFFSFNHSAVQCLNFFVGPIFSFFCSHPTAGSMSSMQRFGFINSIRSNTDFAKVEPCTCNAIFAIWPFSCSSS